MNKIKTIIVDDEVRIRTGIERLLQKFGDNWDIVGVFSDGIEVIEFLKDHTIEIDLLITDVKMPEIDGLTLIKEMKNMNRDNDFSSIIVSGYDDFQFLQTAIREGALDYILKPIDRKQFFEVLQKVEKRIEEKRLETYKWNDLIKQSDQLTLTKQTQLLSEAISSEPEDIAAMYWIKDFPEGVYQACYVSVDEFSSRTSEYSNEDWGAFAFATENIIDEVIMEFKDSEHQQLGWWWREGGFHFWVLLFSMSKENNFFEKGETFTRKLKSCLNKYTPFSFSIAQSNPFEDLFILPEMKKQLHSFIRMRMIYGGNQIYSSRLTNEMKATNGNNGFAANNMKEFASKLTNMLGKSETSKIEKEFSDLFKRIKLMRSPMEIQYSLEYLIIYMFKVYLEDTESGIVHSDLGDILQAIKSETNLNQLEKRVKDTFIQVHKKQLVIQQDPALTPIMKAKKWINEHLSQKITLQDISDYVYMNPTYFCHYFKKQTGKTVFDYITDLRLETAKELLQEQDLKVTEISQLVGYQDSKHFSRLFKQRWGSLPSEFKKKYKTKL
ncbi:response regulator [uncultured Metabacillus sp.]|uniref:response regulator n=1 Tax=uncultured Metabacillus sp. TaxID=2860135 RepID=UPI002635AC9D|nr:response regulator [uncultured Metabacillus sp.]